uniref:SFRICE_014083 n=1 Tax=Spodoptera frugiperda TaxID=7108 RepID=A0A2H1WQ43_SPOFR
MNEEKLSSDKVPQKFAEWLLSMGCPPDKVPTVDKLSEMCRGQYYMVWRSLMEHVEPKEIIRQKRLQVFNDDVQRCRKTNAFCKPDSSTIVPEELTLWKQQTALRERVQDAETRVQQARQELNLLVDKVSSRLSHRNLARARVAAAQRRAWLLQQLGEELRAKRDSLNEARTIADSLCSFDDCSDVENKLDKLTSRRQTPRAPAALSVSMAPLASSSITSNGGDMNDSGKLLL